MVKMDRLPIVGRRVLVRYRIRDEERVGVGVLKFVDCEGGRRRREVKSWFLEGSMRYYFRRGLEEEVLGWEELPGEVFTGVKKGMERKGWKSIEDIPGKLRRVLMICKSGRRKFMGIALRRKGEGGKKLWVFEGNNELGLYPNLMMGEGEVIGWREIPEVKV